MGKTQFEKERERERERERKRERNRVISRENVNERDILKERS